MAKNPQPPAGEQVKAEDVLMMPGTDTVKKLAKARRDAQKQSQSIAGTIGEKIAKAVEEKHLDRKAFSMACQLANMDDERLAITLPHLMRYIDDLELVKRATKQAELFEQESEEAETGGKGSTVTPIGAAARKVAQQAGANPS